MSFEIELPENRRTLAEIVFPDGNTRAVQYMRDGVVVFADGGNNALYERSANRRTVTITPITNERSLHQAIGRAQGQRR